MKIPYDTIRCLRRKGSCFSFYGHPVSRYIPPPTNSPSSLCTHWPLFFSLLIFILILSLVRMYHRFAKMDEGRQGSIDFTSILLLSSPPCLDLFLFFLTGYRSNGSNERSTKISFQRILNRSSSFFISWPAFVHLRNIDKNN